MVIADCLQHVRVRDALNVAWMNLARMGFARRQSTCKTLTMPVSQAVDSLCRWLTSKGMQALQRQYSEPPESTTSDAWEATTPRMNSVQELKAPAGTVNLASVSKPADGRENSNALFGNFVLDRSET